MIEKITAAQAKEIMQSEQGYMIVDVREPEEYDQGHIPGAVNVPLGAILIAPAFVSKNLPDKEQLLLVHCESGARSVKACRVLDSFGYQKLKDFGGICGWSGELAK